MHSAPFVLVVTFLVTAGAMALLWLLSVAKRDASIVDIFWGVGFIIIAMTAAGLGDGYPPRQWLVVGLVTAWGARLALYLAWRNAGKGEDYRYQSMRRRYGERFPIVSLYLVFGLQAALMWIVSLPLQAALTSPVPAELTAADLFGVILWIIGWIFETLGDSQLARFKADPANAERVLDRGLWAYTRHPNYFGDTMVWWGFFSIALPTPAGLLTLVSPVLMTMLLLRVSGVALLERTIVKRRPEYRDYIERTSAFVPWWPKPSRSQRERSR